MNYECYFCKEKVKAKNMHHINGLGFAVEPIERDNRPENLVSICPTCHDKVEAVCGKCVNRKKCNIHKFTDCWVYEDAIPPKHFKSSRQALIDMFSVDNFTETHCPDCKSSNIARISIWKSEGVYSGKPSFRAVYRCKNCNNKFLRKIEGLLERSLDNKRVPIEIKDYSTVDVIFLLG